MAELESDKIRHELAGKQADIKRMWGDPASLILLYPKTKNYQPRIRLIDPATLTEVSMKITDFWRILGLQIFNFPAVPADNATDATIARVKPDWIVACGAIEIDDVKFGPVNGIYFNAEIGSDKFQQKVGKTLARISEDRKAKKAKN